VTGKEEFVIPEEAKEVVETPPSTKKTSI